MSGAGNPLDTLLMFSGGPDTFAQQMAIERQRALAAKLLETKGPDTIGGYPVSPFSHLADSANEMLGAYMLRKADQKQAALYQGLLGGPQSFQGSQTAPQNQASPPAASATQSGSGLGALQEPAPESSQSPQGPVSSGNAPSVPTGGSGLAGTGSPLTFVPPLAGLDQRTAMLRYFQAPQEYMKAYFDSLAMTPEAKNALFATGGNRESAAQLLFSEAQKAGTTELRPGGTAIIPGVGPFSAPAAPPPGSQVQWGANGPQISMVPGAAGAISQSAYAEHAPVAGLNVWEAQNTPRAVTPGEGQVFATPAGGMSVPGGGGLPAPSTNLIGAPPNVGMSNAPQPRSQIAPVPTGKLSLSPEGLELQKKQLPDQLEEIKDTGEAAIDTHYQLQTLRSDLSAMTAGKGGNWFTPGKGAETRIAIAKWVNSSLAAAGQKPYFDPRQVAAAEGTLKTGGRLGFALSRTLGSREAAQIVQQAISLNPGIANTPQGNELVAQSMDAAAQRQADRNNFFADWMSKNGNTMNADIAFNQTHPVSSYVALALAPPGARQALKANPSKASDFDAKYGQGASQRVLNEPW